MDSPKPQDLSFWDLLTDSQQRLVSDSYRVKNLDKRVSIFTAGEAKHSMYFVVNGRVKICRHFGDLRELIVDVIPEGQFVSFQPIVDTPDEIEYAETVLKSVIIQLDTRIVRDLLNENAQFSSFMFQNLTNRYNKVVSRLSMVHPMVLIKQQVVKLILELAEDFGRPVGDEVIIEHGLSHHEMAAIIHRSRQSVTGTMRLLKQEDLINYTRTSILVRDVERLKKWIRDDLAHS
jgi:CRP/FNR family transcriptional regulator